MHLDSVHYVSKETVALRTSSIMKVFKSMAFLINFYNPNSNTQSIYVLYISHSSYIEIRAFFETPLRRFSIYLTIS
jgi:hypothetical protein